MKIDINGVSITLTPEQLAEIARQTNQLKSYKDITSFEKACERQNIDVSDFNAKLGDLSKDEIAFRKLKIIVTAIRSFTNWKPNWSNSSQRKYRIWFDLEKGFSCWRTSYYDTGTYVPSALYVENDEQANFLGNTFLDLFKDYIIEN
jgi:hypothetical protein